MTNQDLIDFDVVSSTHMGCKTGIPRTTVNKIWLPNDQYFEMCYQLNEEQQHLFNFMMGYAIKCHLSEKFDELLPNTFCIFLSGGAGVGKSFLVKTITKYLIRIFKYHSQMLDQPSILVTASNGKAATNINSTT